MQCEIVGIGCFGGPIANKTKQIEKKKKKEQERRGDQSVQKTFAIHAHTTTVEEKPQREGEKLLKQESSQKQEKPKLFQESSPP